MSAYHVEAHPVPVVLDANESPYPVPAKLQEKLFALMAGTLLNRYPDMDAQLLKAACAKKEEVKKEDILFGNGSDDLIQILLGAYCDPGDNILVPTPTFSMYQQAAGFFSAKICEVPLGDNFEYDTDTILSAVKTEKPRIVFIARPNNPTGGVMDKASIDKIAEAMGESGLLVIDEAYIDYRKNGAIGVWYRKFTNVVIMRTLSKVGFAALRLGYLMADAKIIHELNKVRQPFNINALTQVCGTEIFKNWDMLSPMFAEIISERARVLADLSKIAGVTVYPSHANFLLIKIPGDPEAAFNSLLKDGVRVRWFNHAPRLTDCFRVTIGTPVENDAFLLAIHSALS